MKTDQTGDAIGIASLPGDKPRGLGPIEQRQLYEQVVARIIEEIASGSINPGDRLPSERELAETMHVGRPSIREALTSLQQAGIVETRRGAGSYVAETAMDHVREVRARKASWDLSPAALLDAREIIEPNIARLAARDPRPDQRVVELLSEMDEVDDLTDPRQYRAWRDADRDFHLQISHLSGNPVLIGFAEMVSSVMQESLWEIFRDTAMADPSRRKVYVAEHLLIYQAVEEGQADAAAGYARDHIRRVRHFMELDPGQLS